MSAEEEHEVTREGLMELLVGKAKEAAGELVGNEHLIEEGREQQAQAEEDPGAPTHPGAGLRKQPVPEDQSA